MQPSVVQIAHGLIELMIDSEIDAIGRIPFSLTPVPRKIMIITHHNDMIMVLISHDYEIYAYCMYVNIMYIYNILYCINCDSDNELQ